MTSTPHLLLPGAVGITSLSVYDSPGPDGVVSGSPHVHTVCSEAYVVVAGAGRLESLSRAGHEITPLQPGDVVWFGPGTIHRALNDGGLQIVTVMQNAGLPEAGDAVMTFPEQDLRDRATYAAAASIDAETQAGRFERAAARRDRAVLGFTAIADAFDAGDDEPLEGFLSRAVELVRPLAAEWIARIEDGPLASATLALEHTRAVLDVPGNTAHLNGVVARIPQPDAQTAGMCGALLPYVPSREGTHSS